MSQNDLVHQVVTPNGVAWSNSKMTLEEAKISLTHANSVLMRKGLKGRCLIVRSDCPGIEVISSDGYS